MASGIEPGIDTMALAAKAWHGYGTVVDRNMTWDEAPALAGLNWRVEMSPLTTISAQGVTDIDTHRATVRSDTGAVLGIVGADYEPHQPAELLDLARLTVDAGPSDAHVEVLGTLRGGRIVFATIALPDEITIAGDVHLPRLVWATSMDGTLATRVVSSVIRAVCANTLRASFSAAPTSWAAKHTSSLQGRAVDARRALQLVFETTKNFQAEVEALTRQTISTATVNAVLTDLWPDDPDATDRTRNAASRRRAAIRHAYAQDPRVAGWHGTAYGLVQAISTWEQWDAPRRGERGEQILAGMFAGTRTKATVAAERLTALA